MPADATTPAPDVPPAPEVIYVAQKRIACDGGGGALGHPKVWYTMGEDGQVRCGYCDRLYIYDPEKAKSQTA